MSLLPIKNVREELAKPDVPLETWVEGFLAKGSTLVLGAQAKTGKSALCMDLGDCLATARPLFQNPEWSIARPVTSLLLDQEVGEFSLVDRWRNRYSRLGKKAPENLWFASKLSDTFLDGGGYRTILSVVEKVNPDVLICDPLSFFMSEETNVKVRDVFMALQRLRKDLSRPDLGIVLVHHVAKPLRGKEAIYDDPLDPYQLRGASNLVNDPDGLLMLGGRTDVGSGGVQWKLKGRLISRHFKPIPDFTLEIRDDWTVTFRGKKEKPVTSIADLGS